MIGAYLCYGVCGDSFNCSSAIYHNGIVIVQNITLGTICISLYSIWASCYGAVMASCYKTCYDVHITWMSIVIPIISFS